MGCPSRNKGSDMEPMLKLQLHIFPKSGGSTTVRFQLQYHVELLSFINTCPRPSEDENRQILLPSALTHIDFCPSFWTSRAVFLRLMYSHRRFYMTYSILVPLIVLPSSENGVKYQANHTWRVGAP